MELLERKNVKGSETASRLLTTGWVSSLRVFLLNAGRQVEDLNSRAFSCADSSCRGWRRNGPERACRRPSPPPNETGEVAEYHAPHSRAPIGVVKKVLHHVGT